MCRLCGKKVEIVQHITSGCEKLAQKEYKRRHDNVAKKVHWDICKMAAIMQKTALLGTARILKKVLEI